MLESKFTRFIRRKLEIILPRIDRNIGGIQIVLLEIYIMINPVVDN
jgi:hypothetical protein